MASQTDGSAALADAFPDNRAPASRRTTRDQHTNEHLLSLVRTGDESAPSALHSQFAPLVNKLVWRVLGPDPDFADVVHDAFLRIYRGVGRVREASCLPDWIAQVAVNTVRNELRRRKFRRFIPWETTRESVDPSYAPDLEGLEVVRRVYRVLEQLPVTERVVLSVRLFEASSIEQIASICDCSTRTAKRRLQGARLRFERIASRDPLLRTRLPKDGGLLGGQKS
jgi:RNA polymerase sigma-70 factor (ECF subfamily)